MYSAPRSFAIASWIRHRIGEGERTRRAAERAADEEPREPAEPRERQEPAPTRVGRILRRRGPRAPDERGHPDHEAEEPGDQRELGAAERRNDERDGAAEQREEDQRAMGIQISRPIDSVRGSGFDRRPAAVHVAGGTYSQTTSPSRTAVRRAQADPTRDGVRGDVVRDGSHAMIERHPMRSRSQGRSARPGFGREARAAGTSAPIVHATAVLVRRPTVAWTQADRAFRRRGSRMDPVQPELGAVGRAPPLPSREPRAERPRRRPAGVSPVKRPSAGSSSTGKRSSASSAVERLEVEPEGRDPHLVVSGQVGEHASDATSPGDGVAVRCRDDAVRVVSLAIARRSADARPMSEFTMYGSLFLIGAALAVAGVSGLFLPPGSRPASSSHCWPVPA